MGWDCSLKMIFARPDFLLAVLEKFLSLLERFPACTMFPGNPHRPVPVFITFRKNEISRTFLKERARAMEGVGFF